MHPRTEISCVEFCGLHALSPLHMVQSAIPSNKLASFDVLLTRLYVGKCWKQDLRDNIESSWIFRLASQLETFYCTLSCILLHFSARHDPSQVHLSFSLFSCCIQMHDTFVALKHTETSSGPVCLTGCNWTRKSSLGAPHFSTCCSRFRTRIARRHLWHAW